MNCKHVLSNNWSNATGYAVAFETCIPYSAPRVTQCSSKPCDLSHLVLHFTAKCELVMLTLPVFLVQVLYAHVGVCLHCKADPKHKNTTTNIPLSCSVVL